MDNEGTSSGEAWTRQAVEDRLVAAFRLLPTRPVFSRCGQVEMLGGRGGAAEALNWPVAFVSSDRDRHMLLAWARCQAASASFGAICRELGWPRNTAEVGRRRAAETIAAALAAQQKLSLDNGKARPGSSADVGGDLSPADA